MLSGLLQLLGSLFGWLGALLPDSPLADYVQVIDDMALGLGWLNWLMPFSEMLVMLALWIAAMAVVTAVKVALSVSSSVGGKVAQ